MADETLQITVVDVYGDIVQEAVDIFMRNQTLSDSPVFRSVKPSKQIGIKDLQRFPNGLYRLEIDAPSYLAVSHFVSIPPSGPAKMTTTLPVNKDRIVGVDFPPFENLSSDAQRLLTASTIASNTAGALYSGWDNLRKAGFLNLTAKAQRTRLLNDRTVLTYLDRITEQRGDRLFATVSLELRTEVMHAVTGGFFHPVSDVLHTPSDNFQLVDSYKTPERYGNLQLTFSTDGTNWMVDMDIDDAQGFEHLFQVVGNALTGLPTNPYNIHEILVEYQEIDPGYRFILRQQALAGQTLTGQALTGQASGGNN